MASQRFLLLVSLVVLSSCFLFSSQAYKFYVGGKDGWVLNPSENFNHWAERNRFQVNDTLYFKYKKGSDSVLVVNKNDFYNCSTKNPIQKLEDGNSEFKFDRSGPFFFISGKEGSCEKGQKLIVVVLAVRTKPNTPPATSPSAGANPPVTSPAPSHSPSSSPSSSLSPSSSKAPSGAPIKPPISSPATSPSLSPNPPAKSPVSGPSPSSLPPANSPSESPVPTPSANSPASSPVSSPPAFSPSPTTETPPPATSPESSSTTPPPAQPTPTPSGGESSPSPGSQNQESTKKSNAVTLTPLIITSSLAVLATLVLFWTNLV